MPRRSTSRFASPKPRQPPALSTPASPAPATPSRPRCRACTRQGTPLTNRNAATCQSDLQHLSHEPRKNLLTALNCRFSQATDRLASWRTPFRNHIVTELIRSPNLAEPRMPCADRTRSASGVNLRSSRGSTSVTAMLQATRRRNSRRFEHDRPPLFHDSATRPNGYVFCRALLKDVSALLGRADPAEQRSAVSIVRGKRRSAHAERVGGVSPQLRTINSAIGTSLGTTSPRQGCASPQAFISEQAYTGLPTLFGLDSFAE